MVDFSKLRLPAKGVVPGEGTEPAVVAPVDKDVVVTSEVDAHVARSVGEVLVEASDDKSMVSITPLSSVKVAGDDVVQVESSSEAAVGGDGVKPGGASGLRLRLPSRLAGAAIDSMNEPAGSKLGEPAAVVAAVTAVIEEPLVDVGAMVSNVPEVENVENKSSLVASEVAVGDVLGSIEDLHQPLEDGDVFLSEFSEDDFAVDEIELYPVELGNEEFLFPSRDIVNPLLEDDDEDELLSGAVLAQRLGLKSGLTELVDDEPEEDGEVFTGFDDQFQALLEDDDEVSLIIPSVVLKPAATLKPVPLTPLKVDDEKPVEVLSVAPKWQSVVVPVKYPKSSEELEAEAALRKVSLREKEAEAKRVKEFASDFIGDTTNVVKVDAFGETKREQGKVRNRLVRGLPGGKMKSREVDFFKSLGTVRAEFSDGMITTDLITGPLGRGESNDEKKGRLDHLERVLDSRNLFRSGKTFKLDSKTVDTLCFLALFRYATHSHLARMFGESPRTTQDRLYRMRGAGLVASKKIYSQHAIWFLTEPGVIVSGYDMKHITEAKLTPSMFPHQFTVNHVAANLMGGKLNVLNLPDFPVTNRLTIKGEPLMGEQLTSELEILSSFAKIKLFEQSATFRPKLLSMRDREFSLWNEAKDKVNVFTPEMIFGNEWMFTLFPPLAVGVAYHVPDLVVKRQRAVDGTPRSIAVEIEINNKPTASYEKTLRAYADDKLIFGQVIWVCKTIGPAKKLEKVGRDLGIIQSGKLKVVPIYTNEGVFKGRDLWTI